jgi:hypothetical protein
MAGTTRGDPTLLDAASEQMEQATASLAAPVTAYEQAMRRLAHAPSDLPIDLPGRGARLRGLMAELRVVDRQPALFAAALRMADHLAARGLVGGAPGLAARVQASLGDVDASELREVAMVTEALAVDIGTLIAGDGDPEDVLAELAQLLSTLDVEDPFVLAAFVEALGPGGLQELLAWLVWAPDP